MYGLAFNLFLIIWTSTPSVPPAEDLTSCPSGVAECSTGTADLDASRHDTETPEEKENKDN